MQSIQLKKKLAQKRLITVSGQTDCAEAFHRTYIVPNVQITCIQLAAVVTFTTRKNAELQNTDDR